MNSARSLHNFTRTVDVSPITKDERYVKQLEDRVKKMETELVVLRKTNAEQDQKLHQLTVLEERYAEYEQRCRESDSYKQKCKILDEQLRKLQLQADQSEDEKLKIIESYEKKLQDQKAAKESTVSTQEEADEEGDLRYYKTMVGELEKQLLRSREYIAQLANEALGDRSDAS